MAYWLVVYVLFIALYAIKSNYALAAYTNLFYIPIHIAYFYIMAYWLIPKYLLSARYFKFSCYLFAFVFISTLISRMVDILITEPFMLKHMRPVYWGFLEAAKHTFWERLTEPVTFTAALKMANQVVWFTLGIKLFKLWVERKQAALKAELKALKAQIHPHFLFNTLNNLYALTLTNSPRSSQVVMGLSDLLRYMLYECNADQASLQQEVLMLQQYIGLEKIRYEERLDLTFTINGLLDDKTVAPLMLLPFIENAFKHGTSDTIGQAWINIDLTVTGNLLKFKVSNSKPAARDQNINIHHGHIGLQNVTDRLNLLYPKTHQLKIINDEEAFLIVLELEIITVNSKTKQLVTA